MGFNSGFYGLKRPIARKWSNKQIHVKGNQGSLRFCEASTFHRRNYVSSQVSPCANRRNCRIWEQNRRYKFLDNCSTPCERDSAIWNVTWPCSWVFVFAENKVKCNVYLDKLQLLAFPQTGDIESGKETAFVFLQNAASAHPLLAQGFACSER